jgi:hypothetical protein
MLVSIPGLDRSVPLPPTFQPTNQPNPTAHPPDPTLTYDQRSGMVVNLAGPAARRTAAAADALAAGLGGATLDG